MAKAKAELSVTERRNEKSRHLDKMSIREIVGLMNEEDRTVANSVQAALPQISAAIEEVAQAVKQGGSIYYVGAGTSGRLGVLDASECPPTFGADPGLVVGLIAGGEKAVTRSIENAEDDHEAGKREVAAKVTDKDVVVGIAASGSTRYVIGALREAGRIGAVTVALSCNIGSPISAEARYPIEVPVGPEVIAGSTRLKAGTATKMVLNMISTVVMVRLGKVYGNLMVNVQATNAKLKERVVRIVKDATSADEKTAAEVAERANGDARAAILMVTYQIGYKEAIRQLDEAGGHFGDAFASLARK